MKLLASFGTSQYPQTNGPSDPSTLMALQGAVKGLKRKKEVQSYRDYKDRVEAEKEGLEKLSKKVVRNPVMPRVLRDKVSRQKRIETEKKEAL